MPRLAIKGGAPIRSKPFPHWPQWDEREEENLLSVLRSGKWFRYEGRKVAEFEERFAEYQGAKYGLAVNSGTAALEASLAAVGVGRGDEVIVPSYTFMATAAAVLTVGGTPVFADIDVHTANIDLASAEELVGPRTRAMVVVHFGGCPCDMEAVSTFAEKHELAVVEDAAHAHGGKWDGRGLGSFGQLGAFSFQNSKNITAGEGGIVLTSDEEYMNRVFSYHSYGQRRGYPWYSHHVVSRNLRMTEWQGAVLSAQLERLGEQTERRLRSARRLDLTVDGLDALAVMGFADPRAEERAYHLYQFRYAPGIPGVTKDQFIAALRAEGIPCSPGYPMPLQQQPLFATVAPPEGLGSYAAVSCPNTERLCQESIWLTQNLLLGTDEDISDICGALEKVLENAAELR